MIDHYNFQLSDFINSFLTIWAVSVVICAIYGGAPVIINHNTDSPNKYVESESNEHESKAGKVDLKHTMLTGCLAFNIR